MKITNTVLFLLIFLSVSCAQDSKRPISIEDSSFDDYFFKEKNIPIVKGKIINLDDKNFKNIRIHYTISTHFNDCPPKKFAKLNTDGAFELELDYAFPYQQIFIEIDSLYMAYIYANSDLYIELDAKILNSINCFNYIGPGIKFWGSDGELNIYLINFTSYKKDYQKKLRHGISYLRDNEMPTEEFVQKYDTINNILRAICGNYIKDNPSKYSWMIKDEWYAEYYALLCYKYTGYLIKNGKRMSQELWDKMNKYKPYLVSHNSINFYKYLFSYITILSKVENSNTQLVDMIRLIDTSFNQGKADFLKTKFSSDDVGQRDLINKVVLPTIKTKWCKSIIQSEIEKNNEKVKSINNTLKALKNDSVYNYIGKPYAENKYGARLYVIDSLNAADLLSNLRMKFKGKALFIDFWATWCSGCIQDMPYSKKLHEEIKDLPIEFIYLCTSERTSLDKWISNVSKYELSGTHIYVNNKIENELMDIFFLNAFPGYVLIDIDGVYKQGIIRPSLTNKNIFIELIKGK